MPASAKLQALIHAGLIADKDAKSLPADLKKRIESLSDAEITHLCSAKSKLGEHTKSEKQMMLI